MFSTLEATYARDKGILSGPIGPLAIDTIVARSSDPRMPKANAKVPCNLTIAQGPKRTIRITTSEPVYWSRLLEPLYQLERLLMLFDGSFVPLSDLEFTNGQNIPQEYDSAAKNAREEALIKR